MQGALRATRFAVAHYQRKLREHEKDLTRGL
jgi:hypothetical protein